MHKFKYLFGPVPSRRFGRSLGVDLLGTKTCSFDCVFCQIKRTENWLMDRHDYVPVSEVIEELDEWFNTGGEADYVTLSGSGEPTLHMRFGEVIEYARARGPRRCALLTNGSTLWIDEVREGASLASVVKVSLSAWDEDSFKRICRPCAGLAFDRVVDGQRLFRREFGGDLWMEVFIVEGMNDSSDQVKRIAEVVATIRPDRVHLNTAVRPAAEKFVKPVSQERLEAMASLFTPVGEVIADWAGDRQCKTAGSDQAVLDMIKRHPCTTRQVADMFDWTDEESCRSVERLVSLNLARAEPRSGETYFVAV